jgi:hypothetical protein
MKKVKVQEKLSALQKRTAVPEKNMKFLQFRIR